MKDYSPPNSFTVKNPISTQSPNAVAHGGALTSAPSTATQPNSSSVSTLGLWDEINASRQSSYTDINKQFTTNTNVSAPSSPFALPCPATLQAYSFDTVITRTLSPIKVKPPPTQDPQTGDDTREAANSPNITCPEMLIAPSAGSLTMMSLGSQVGSNASLYSNPSDRAPTIIHSRSASSTSSSSGIVCNPNAYDPNAVGAVTAARMAAALMAEHHQSPQPSPNDRRTNTTVVLYQSLQYYQNLRAAAAAAADEEPDVYVSVPGMKKRQPQQQPTSSKASSEAMPMNRSTTMSSSSRSSSSNNTINDNGGQQLAPSAQIELKGLLRTVYSISADSSTTSSLNNSARSKTAND
jgi:hypothetical protein